MANVPSTALIAASREFFGELGEWAQQTWADHNVAYFGGALRPLPILWGLTPHGRALGFYRRAQNITLHLSLVREQSNAWDLGGLLGPRFASDVLLHEMVHQANHEGGYRGQEAHECEPWCAEITRISPLIGLDCKAKLIKRQRVDGRQLRIPEPGYMTQGQISTWPHSVRPREYYEAAAAPLLEQIKA
jgi:hypothetical protein